MTLENLTQCRDISSNFRNLAARHETQEYTVIKSAANWLPGISRQRNKLKTMSLSLITEQKKQAFSSILEKATRVIDS